MENKKAKAVIEAILFTMGDSVEIVKLAEITGLSEEEIKSVLAQMQTEYEERDGGIRLLLLEHSVQLCTKKELYEYIIQIAKVCKKPTLSEAALETLSIVAYKQPITRVEIEKIRGVASHRAIDKLLECELIQELGRLDAPGKPILFGTTEQFLRSFGLESISQMPALDMDKMEEFKEQAEAEIGLYVGV